jgi:circadian clock protein KaiB
MAKYKLQLYISGETQVSLKAIEIMNSICTDHLNGDCDIETIDILKDPEKAEKEGIMAIPTLIRKWPLPEIRLIGALSIKTRILTGLGIEIGEES